MRSRGADMHVQTNRCRRQGVEIEMIYAPSNGASLHLEVCGIRPERAHLPITETGYRSHFHAPGTIAALGGDVVVQVIAWLDEEAARPDWQIYVDASRQGDLFG